MEKCQLTFVRSTKADLFLGAPCGEDGVLFTWWTSSCNKGEQYTGYIYNNIITTTMEYSWETPGITHYTGVEVGSWTLMNAHERTHTETEVRVLTWLSPPFPIPRALDVQQCVLLCMMSNHTPIFQFSVKFILQSETSHTHTPVCLHCSRYYRCSSENKHWHTPLISPHLTDCWIQDLNLNLEF